MINKRELKRKYKNIRPDMGVFKIESGLSGSCYLYSSHNLVSLMNRCRFELRAGSHTNRALQNEWKEFGGDSFSFEVLEKLDYDRDESKTDYSEELDLLRLIWAEKLEATA